jgi:uncharacterized protein
MNADPAVPRWLAEAMEGMRSADVDGWMELYADDAVHEFPFAPADAPQRLEGKEAIRAAMAAIGERVRFGTMSDLRVIEAGEETVVEAEGHHQDAATGAAFDLRYVWIITRRDGRVTRFRDYTGARQPAGEQS